MGHAQLPQERGPYFPALLGEAGVRTASFAAFDHLAGARCVVRGFAEETRVGGEAWADAEQLGEALLARLVETPPSQRVLAFAHFMDAHHPYDGEGAGERERWLDELARVDAQIDRLLAGIAAAGLRDRTFVVLTADHGEAFGEHGTHMHGSTLYEEVVRVPLVVAGPGHAPRRVHAPVSLLDVAPTLLDLFGVATPGTFMGESLVPYLRGQDPTLTRPIAIEARPKQAMIFPGGIKAIRDLDNAVVELYDLRADPRELDNLCDRDVDRLAPHIGRLVAYFDAHEHRAPGYRVPIR